MQAQQRVETPQEYVSSATRMLERRRQMIELQQELAKQQAVYAEKAGYIDWCRDVLPSYWVLYSTERPAFTALVARIP